MNVHQEQQQQQQPATGPSPDGIAPASPSPSASEVDRDIEEVLDSSRPVTPDTSHVPPTPGTSRSSITLQKVREGSGKRRHSTSEEEEEEEEEDNDVDTRSMKKRKSEEIDWAAVSLAMVNALKLTLVSFCL